MTFLDRAKRYMLPLHATAEDLDLRGLKTLVYGDKLVAIGYFYHPDGKNYYCGVYEYLSDDRTCEGVVGLREVCTEQFEDQGHAAAWGLGL